MPSPQEVVNMQKVLAQLGTYKGPWDGNQDNPQFVQALENYQSAHGMTPTGRMDIATMGPLQAFFNGIAGKGTSAADMQTAIDRYGPQFQVYLQQPSLAPVIIQAAKEGKDANWVLAELQKTDYWKATQDSSRQWDQLLITDPASASQQLQQSVNVVQDKVKSAGIDWLTSPDIQRLASDRIRYNWGADNDAMFNNVLAQVLSSRPGGASGELVGSVGTTMETLKAQAAQQLLALDDNTAYSMATKIMSGEATTAAYDVQFRNQAKAKVPSMAQLIDQGVTLSDIFAQHKQKIATQLEIAPEQVDLINDPTWRPILNYADPKTGTIRPMTENEAEILARQQEGYKTTDIANERGADVTDFLSRQWGVRPTA